MEEGSGGGGAGQQGEARATAAGGPPLGWADSQRVTRERRGGAAGGLPPPPALWPVCAGLPCSAAALATSPLARSLTLTPALTPALTLLNRLFDLCLLRLLLALALFGGADELLAGELEVEDLVHQLVAGVEHGGGGGLRPWADGGTAGRAVRATAEVDLGKDKQSPALRSGEGVPGMQSSWVGGRACRDSSCRQAGRQAAFPAPAARHPPPAARCRTHPLRASPHLSVPCCSEGAVSGDHGASLGG